VCQGFFFRAILVLSLMTYGIFGGYPRLYGASDGPAGRAADAERLVAAIVEVLPKNWTHERSSTGMVLRPKERPLSVSIVSAPGPTPGESKDDYLRRHAVRRDYCITLEFAPKIAISRVQTMLAENTAISRKIKKIRGTEIFRRSKGVPIPDSPEGVRLVAEYERLVGSLRRIPDGCFDETSVYIQTTNWGYAQFLSKETREECEGVKARVSGLLSPYQEKQRTNNKE
jgi:hypothetical protein